jgi:(1->4)-alpha-D-glucan 1-alpha-D-glucosylmutase
MKIHIISAMPKKWALLTHMWKNENQKYKTQIGKELFPDLNTEYFIYQLLIGAHPMGKERIWGALNKAIREMGVHTCWEKINVPYEKAVKKFFEEILLLTRPFQKEVEEHALLASLSSLVLKIGSCGIVDIYQGNEWFHLSLVDPDNRRPVNFKRSKDEKFFITEKALNFRKKHKDLFLKGEYLPIKAPDSVVVFMRKWKKKRVIVLAQRFFNHRAKGSVALPKGETFINIFTKEKIQGKVHFEEVFKKYPCAILEPLSMSISLTS